MSDSSGQGVAPGAAGVPDTSNLPSVERFGGELKRFGREGGEVAFKVVSPFEPTGDQPQAIEKLAQGLRDGTALPDASGRHRLRARRSPWPKTIEAVGSPALIMEPQQDAGGPGGTASCASSSPTTRWCTSSATTTTTSPRRTSRPTDTYIEKDSSINEDIEKLRHQATASLLSRRDVIVVASVSCIYGIGSPQRLRGARP